MVSPRTFQHLLVMTTLFNYLVLYKLLNQLILIHSLRLCQFAAMQSAFLKFIVHIQMNSIFTWCQCKLNSFLPYIVSILFKVRIFFISHENLEIFQQISMKYSPFKIIIYKYNFYMEKRWRQSKLTASFPHIFKLFSLMFFLDLRWKLENFSTYFSKIFTFNNYSL